MKAAGDIIADGFIESAQLEAGGDIILKEGTNAGGRGLLKAGGNVMGKFFENATIEAAGSVKANYCLNSNIVAGRKYHHIGKIRYDNRWKCICRQENRII